MNTCYFKMTRSSSYRAGGVNHCGLQREPDVYEHLNTDTYSQLTERGGQSRTCAQRPGILFFASLFELQPAADTQTHTVIRSFVDSSVAGRACRAVTCVCVQ